MVSRGAMILFSVESVIISMPAPTTEVNCGLWRCLLARAECRRYTEALTG